MKSLNTIINEKLVINKNSKSKELIFNFEEFKKFLSKELNYETKKLNIDFNQKYSEKLFDKLKESTFIEITNDEWNYYLTNIANCPEDSFKRCYIMKEVPNNFIIFSYQHHNNESPEEYYSVIGYILGDINNLKNKYNIRLFKYKVIK